MRFKVRLRTMETVSPALGKFLPSPSESLSISTPCRVHLRDLGQTEEAAVRILSEFRELVIDPAIGPKHGWVYDRTDHCSCCCVKLLF